MTKSDALGPHERWIRRREAKVSDVGGKKTLRLSPIYYTSIAEIKGFRFKLERPSTPQRNHQENGTSSPRQASADPQRPFRRDRSPRCRPDPPEARLLLSRARRRHSAGFLHSVRFAGTRSLGASCSPLPQLLCRALGLSEDFGCKGLTNDMLRPLRRASLSVV